MTAQSVLQARFELLQKSFWTKENTAKFNAVFIVTHERERRHIYTLDDSLYVWLFQSLEPLAYLILEPDSIHIFVKDSQYDALTDFLRLPFMKVSKASDGIKEMAFNYVKERGFEKIAITSDNYDELNELPIIVSNHEIEEILVVHENTELTRVRNAVKISDHALNKILEKRLESIIQDHEPTKCTELSRSVEAELNNPDSVGLKFKQSDVTPAFPPAITCGKHIDLSFPPQCFGNITSDVISATVGVRYKMYVGAVGRTYIINPTDRQKKAYKSMIKARDKAIQAIKVGSTYGDVYKAYKEAMDDEFKKYIPKTIGTLAGIQVYSSQHEIEEDSTEIFKEGVSIILYTALENVEEDGKEPFSFQTTDTIQIIPSEGVRIVSKSQYKFKYIAFSLDNKDEKEQLEEILNDNTNIAERTRQRTSNKDKDSRKREESELLLQFKNATENDMINEKKEEGASFNHISYDDPKKIPIKLRGKTDKIFIDQDAKTVLFPIYGVMVPFHISTIKQTKEEEVEARYSNISIQFDIPKNIPANNANQVYIKGLMFSTPGIGKFTDVSKQITKLRQQYLQYMKKKKDDKDLYQASEKFEKLTENIPRIGGGNLHIRPALTGKKNQGNLEAHKNAFRYRSSSGDQLIVFYKNVRLAILQLSQNETNTVFHLLLKKPIKIANKSTLHVTFFKQVVESAVDTSIRGLGSMTDQAEFAEEERERKIRKKINKEFKVFAKAVKELDGFSAKIEQPERELGFYGVPDKSRIYLMPTISALVSVNPQEVPFVLMRFDIEIAVFERLQQRSSTFDLVFILTGWETKDSSQTSYININTIDIEYEERIKGWLEVILNNKKPYVSPMNFDWKTIMPKLRKKYDEFVKEGGWDAFFESDEEEQDEDTSSAFDPDDEEFDGDDDDDDDEEFDEEPDEDEDEGEYEDTSDEGQDWRQLEEEARAADARNAHKFDDSEDEDRHHSRHHSSSRRHK